MRTLIFTLALFFITSGSYHSNGSVLGAIPVWIAELALLINLATLIAEKNYLHSSTIFHWTRKKFLIGIILMLLVVSGVVVGSTTPRGAALSLMGTLTYCLTFGIFLFFRITEIS